MSDVEQLERRVQELSPEELAKFRVWFFEYDADLWIGRLPRSEAGKRDELIAEARADFKAGQAREL